MTSGKLSGKKFNGLLGTLVMSYNSLGAIYGDLGTSPLYTVSSIITSEPEHETDVLRGISCVFWLFTIIVIFKYTFLVLTYGPNNNEGGQIAIYSKIARTLHIGPVGVKIPGDSKSTDQVSQAPENDDNLLALTRTNTRNSTYSDLVNTKMKAFLSKFTIGLCFYGCSLVFSDGLLTPTTSVLSAIAGIAVAKPSFEDKVMPISCVVLICLFMIQRYGSGKLSVVFSPIIAICFESCSCNQLLGQ
ncbi:unnamed protein product [Ambrosiozyma monospora]|uniref:Unnamed protein product n=1 Tax=Ambrosiozyma monospora TaxID=43982 RepID=A0ACB5U9J3_AMBMO|nr:unnamed protein product [Ambrosiozyma monospora]